MIANPIMTLKRARERAGLSQAQLAIKAGIDPRHLAQVETLRIGLSSDVATKTAQALNVDPDELRAGQLVEQGMAMVEALMKFDEGELPRLLKTNKGASLFQGAIAALLAISDSQTAPSAQKAAARQGAAHLAHVVKETLGQTRSDEMSTVVQKAAERKAEEAREFINRDSLGRAIRSEPRKPYVPEGADVHVDSSGREYYRDSRGRARRVR